MPEPARIKGMSARELASLFPPASGAVPLSGGDPQELANSADEVVLELESRGWNARVVQLSDGDLRYLDPSSMLQLMDGTWVRFRSRARKSVDVVTAAGRGRVSLETLQAQLSGVAVQLIPKLPAGNLWRKIRVLLVQRRGVLIQVVVATLLMTVLALLPPQLTRLMMDRALPGRASSLLDLLALCVVFVALFRAWIDWVRSALILQVNSQAEATMNGGFLAHLLSLPFSYLNRKTAGELLQGFAGLSAAQGLLTERVVGAAFDGITAVLFLIVLFVMLPGPALAVLAAAAIMGALTIYFSRAQAILQRQETDAQIQQRDSLVELLSGVAIIKASGSEDRKLRGWLQRLKTQLSVALSRQRVSLWSSATLELTTQTLTVVILIWGARLVLSDELTVGGLIAFQQMSGAVVGSVMGLAGAYSAYAVLKPQLAVATEVLALEPAPGRYRERPGALSGPIVLDRIWFRYEPHLPWTLHDVSFEVQPGEKHWIQGPSGFGKSTLLRLIAGIYTPEKGTITIAGKRPSDANSLMIYLPQFVQLYGTSILENLRIFSGGATRKRLMEAAEASGLHALVSGLPMGYETALPSSGTTLSGGERQLVALTAVMASDRGLFLLDEGLANVDWLSRFWIANSPWFDGKTIIYASHDIGFGR